ncbi:fumarylacetoacetase [Scytonema millei]|uniref:fumarylacetoacetase n=1 Tax=Scytonema millei VB511283 TaxID=1245923 RepID=A0A9X5I6T8_9CYAN|nr:fumarylacetoacetase [Scytonema millei]NHC37410.1 fumarylacetoacetase [Scytonema millei VB511283]
MIRPINSTHNPNLRSWVDSANQKNTDFPIQNLPFGVFRPRNSNNSRIGVAIGDRILDLTACCQAGLLQELPQELQAACTAPKLNQLMAMGSKAASALRNRLSHLLRADAQNPPLESKILCSMSEAELLLPANIGDYTDFYASIFHATNVGKLFRPDNPLLPNYKYVPIAYHGRASSIVPSGTAIARPKGQRKNSGESVPSFGFSQHLDYELEVGFFISNGNQLGHPISIDDVEEHIFGLCLVNDWSARDIQAWEYQPLGPFLSKSFATTISPWVVTLEALAPFRCASFQRPQGDPLPLPYLSSAHDTKLGGIDLTVEALIRSEQMRAAEMQPFCLSRASFKSMYWTLAQMLAHHSSNGCNLRSGDLLASGTVSGAEAGTQGCLLEITQRGSKPIQLPTGEVSSYLNDGDEIELRGYCEQEGYARVGFGECRGRILSNS